MRSPGSGLFAGIALAAICASGPCSAATPPAAAPGAAAPVPGAAPRPGDAAPAWGPPGWMRASDQRFILMMIPHHEGAIAMADLALVRARHPELRALARRIAAAQRRENARMRDWYRQWYGTEVPALEAGFLRRGAGPGMGMGMGAGMGSGLGWGMGPGMGMGLGLQGMETSLDALRTAPDFDRTFIEQMIPHHRMGVMMAAHALPGTDHRELRSLQEAMVRVQSQEIAQMAAWYRRWYGR